MNGVYRVTRHGARGSEKTLEAKLIIQTSAVATSLLSLCAENWKATLEDDKRPTKRKEGRKEKLTRVHRPKNSLRFASTKSLFSTIARAKLSSTFLLSYENTFRRCNNEYSRIYTRARERFAIRTRTLLKFFVFRFSANETVKPIVSRHHLHHHRIVLGRA